MSVHNNPAQTNFVYQAMVNGGFREDMERHDFMGMADFVGSHKDVLHYLFKHKDYDELKEAYVKIRWLPEEQIWIGEYV